MRNDRTDEGDCFEPPSATDAEVFDSGRNYGMFGVNSPHPDQAEIRKIGRTFGVARG